MPPRAGYIAEQNESGTWNILDVPVFAVVSMETSGGETFEFDSAWMADALDWHQFKVREDDYLEPLNVHHDSDKRGKVHAGRFLPTRIGSFEFDGRQQETMFADLLRIPDDVYQGVKSGVISYVSAECNNVHNRRFSALAFMPDTSPQHKFPPVTIREERVANRTNGRALAIAASETGGDVLSLAANEGGLRRITTMKTLTGKTIDRISGEYVFTFSDGSSSRGRDPLAFEFEEAPAPEKKDDESAEAEEGGGGIDAAACISAIEDGTISVADFEAISAAMAARAGASAEPAAGEPAPGDNPVEPAEMQELRGQLAESKAINIATQGRVDSIEAKAARTTALAAAREAITPTGIVVQDAEFAEAYDEMGGASGLTRFVDTLKKHGARGAPATSEEVVRMDGLPSDFEFSENPGTAASQLEAYRQYDKTSAFTKRKYTREQYVQNMAR